MVNIVSPYLETAANDADQNELQQVLDGFYTANGLADPTTIINCVDTTDAALLVSFLPKFFKQASSVLTVASAITTAQTLGAQLNPATITCLVGNAEVNNLATVYDVANIQAATAVSYISSHVSSFTTEFGALLKLWNAGNYSGVGSNAALFAQNLIQALNGNSLNVSDLSNLEIQQEFYNGLFSQQGLANPTYIAQCYNNTSAADFVAFAPVFLKEASSLTKISQAFTDLQTFTNEQAAKYPEITECLTGNTELSTFYAAIGVKNTATVQTTLSNYITANLLSTTSAFSSANSSWTSASYSKSGTQVSAWLKKALAKNA